MSSLNNQQLYNKILTTVKSVSSESYVTFDSREYIAVVNNILKGEKKEYRATTLLELKEIVDEVING
ncbi:hypothetical protein [Francisella marina]|uniref:hypothetical protein n=1 Tax=Francisella marina TaxID=2249302 RepID=UPI0011EF9460|nr:hypothetical protein [Francisella marina]QEO58303.1 hypothetical protein F0R75_00400 [Francisella marina]